MLEPKLQKMRQGGVTLRAGLAQQITEYVAELDETYNKLRNDAFELLDKIKPSKGANVSGSKLGSKSRDKRPDHAIIIGIIDATEDDLSAKTIADKWRSRYPGRIVPDRAIRRILSRLAKQADSPLRLLRRGAGTEPNVYRKTRPVLPK